jgi:hypothetical protein
LLLTWNEFQRETWNELQREALEIGLEALPLTEGNIPEALYKVYEHYREKFLAEYGDDLRTQALEDARALERYVSQTWAETLTHASILQKGQDA